MTTSRNLSGFSNIVACFAANPPDPKTVWVAHGLSAPDIWSDGCLSGRSRKSFFLS